MLTQRTLGFFAVVGLAFVACTKTPAPVANADRDTIRLMVDNFTKAVAAGDFATAASYYAEDGMILPPNAPTIEGRAAVQSFLTSFPKITGFTQRVVELETNGDLGYARLTYQLSTTPPGAKAPLNDTGKAIIILRKQINGTWLTTRAILNSDLAIKTLVAKANPRHDALMSNQGG
ncbi:MAG: YybH family protein [Gemmatimonadaceae bacterium]